MRIRVASNARFAHTPDGRLWSPTAAYGYDFWTRYLEVFDAAEPLVRSDAVERPPQGWVRACGPGVEPIRLRNFRGVRQFARYGWRMRSDLRRAVRAPAALLLRVPSIVSIVAWRALPVGRPYGVEVLGDPHDSLDRGAYAHPLRPLFRRFMIRNLERQCAGAAVALYVTERALQRRYPAAKDAYSVGVSDVLVDDFLVSQPRPAGRFRRPLRLVCVGRLDTLHKAPDALIDAVARCAREGVELSLSLVGDGALRGELERRAAAAGVAERVAFAGQLPSRDAVIAALDEADVFVLPSRHEGLPRAMVEAMARALPCVGSTVGGIPELLQPPELVPPGDVGALARTLRGLATDPQRLAALSAGNLETARRFRESELAPRRREAYRALSDATREAPVPGPS